MILGGRPGLALAAVLLLSACSARRVWRDDPSLTDARPPASAQEPAALLAEAAASADPEIRARALHWRVRAATPEDLAAVALPGLFDPDTWVQRATVAALATRLPEPEARRLLGEALRREGGEAGARARAGFALLDAGVVDEPGLTDAWRSARGLGRRGQLALVALRAGEAAAREPLASALAQADWPPDLGLARALARAQDPALLPALAEGQGLAEPELALVFAAVAAAWGAPGALPTWRGLGDDDARYEAVRVCQAVPSEACDRLVRSGRRADDPQVRAAAQERAGTPSARALGVEEPAAWRHALGEAARHPSVDTGWVSAAQASAVRALEADDLLMPALGAALLAELPGHARGEAALRARLGDDDPLLRVEVAGALLLSRGRGPG